MDSLLGEGLCERFDSASVTLIEWADRCVSWWPEDRLELRLEVAKNGRKVQISGLGPRSQELCAAFEKTWKKGSFQ
jgi:tRNA A37 threonylcarbamoyladenosine biosynthesis protein TsaE